MSGGLVIGDGDMPLDPLDDLLGRGTDLQPIDIGVGGALGGAVGAVAGAINTANKKAKEQGNADAMVGTACADCKEDPCEELAKGKEGSKYKGGSHREMQKPRGDKKDSHHMPARSVVKQRIHPDDAPSIQMDATDHRNTYSYGRSPDPNPRTRKPGDAFLQTQRSHVNSGRFRYAQGIDIAEVRTKFPGKYDDAITQMEAYTECLEQKGEI